MCERPEYVKVHKRAEEILENLYGQIKEFVRTHGVYPTRAVMSSDLKREIRANRVLFSECYYLPQYQQFDMSLGDAICGLSIEIKHNSETNFLEVY